MKTIRLGLGWWGMRGLPLEKRWEFAREMGFRTVETGIGDRPGSVSPGKGEMGIRTIREWLSRLMNDLPPEIGITFDPANLKAAAGEPIDWVLPIVGERICYVHLKDWKPVSEGWIPCAVGEASLDYRELIPAIAYDGIYLLEYEKEEDFAGGVGRSIAALKEVGFSVVRA